MSHNDDPRNDAAIKRSMQKTDAVFDAFISTRCKDGSFPDPRLNAPMKAFNAHAAEIADTFDDVVTIDPEVADEEECADVLDVGVALLARLETEEDECLAYFKKAFSADIALATELMIAYMAKRRKIDLMEDVLRSIYAWPKETGGTE